jgi:hypothetical protein
VAGVFSGLAQAASERTAAAAPTRTSRSIDFVFILRLLSLTECVGNVITLKPAEIGSLPHIRRTSGRLWPSTVRHRTLTGNPLR